MFLGSRLTYRQLKAQVDHLASHLHQMGVRKGDRVAIMLPNCPQTVIAYYATLSLGAVTVLTSPLYKEGELEHQWAESGVETVFVLDLLWPRVEELRRKLRLKRVIVTGVQDYLPFPKNVLFPFRARGQGKWVKVPSGDGIFQFKRLVRSGPPPPPPADLSPDDLACLQYTGGTTGLPKGAMLTHRNLVASVTQIRAFLLQGHQDAQDRAIAILPLFHVYGMNGVMNLGVHLAATLRHQVAG
jgi:long-chain acyl-CoA synthetase